MFPIFGIVLYVLFALNSPSKRLLNKYTNFDKSVFVKSNEYKEEVYKLSKNYKGQIKYIENMSCLNSYKKSSS